MKTVAIIEGFAGGPFQTKTFRRALVDAGFEITKNRRTADIIVAHSAGIYAIPRDNQAKLLMLIGPTYWPSKKLTIGQFGHIRSSGEYFVSNFGWASYLRKKALEIYYAITKNRYMWLGILNNNKLNFLDHGDRKVILVRNRDDRYTTPDIKVIAKKYPNVEFVELPGLHEDYYENPKPYIKLIRRSLG